jgi:heat-inducible transcriptional repressor
MTGTKLQELPSERAQHLLRVLVQRYIREGTPVGSRTLSKDSGLDLSPATIRNIMSDLEELGFVAAPHTSAGRVPTDKGYRFFVDTLIDLRPPDDPQLRQLQRMLGTRDEGTQAVVASASKLLSTVTQLAGLVTLPRTTHAALRQIEFLPLSERRVLAILVVNNREVQNRILHVSREFSQDELRQAANYLNEQFAGRDLEAVRVNLLEDLEQTQRSMDKLMRDAISLARDALVPATAEGEFVLDGAANLIGLNELSNMEKLKQLFEAFNRQRDILHLLDQSMHSNGVQIFIGRESGYQLLDECSVVTAPYTTADEVAGVLGVIGPTRMAYERVIPIVDITAKLLSAALKPRS